MSFTLAAAVQIFPCDEAQWGYSEDEENNVQSFEVQETLFLSAYDP